MIASISSQRSNLMGTQDVTTEQLLQGTQAVSGLNSPWSPLAWGGRGLVDLGEGRWLPGLFFLALALVSSGAVFWVALNAAERLYYTGWASMQVGTRRKKGLRSASRLARGGASGLSLGRLLPDQVGAIMRKDSLQLHRDLRNLSQLVSPMIMGISGSCFARGELHREGRPRPLSRPLAFLACAPSRSS
jgi:hypothetical protein